jgi:hypothetical protein
VPKADYSDPKRSPETVLVIYQVKPGKEFEMEGVLERAWKIYTREHLVFPRPHTVLLDRSEANKPRIIETFTWVSRSIPDNAPDSVKDIWSQMQALCENRDGHNGLEIGEVEIIGPKK